MYKVVYKEESFRHTVWCYGRECSTVLCKSLYQSPYIEYVFLYDADDNIVEVWGLV